MATSCYPSQGGLPSHLRVDSALEQAAGQGEQPAFGPSKRLPQRPNSDSARGLRNAAPASSLSGRWREPNALARTRRPDSARCGRPAGHRDKDRHGHGCRRACSRCEPARQALTRVRVASAWAGTATADPVAQTRTRTANGSNLASPRCCRLGPVRPGSDPAAQVLRAAEATSPI